MPRKSKEDTQVAVAEAKDEIDLGEEGFNLKAIGQELRDMLYEDPKFKKLRYLVITRNTEIIVSRYTPDMISGRFIMSSATKPSSMIITDPELKWVLSQATGSNLKFFIAAHTP